MTDTNNAIYIVVMGVSGCGKSTIASRIASALGNAEFIDGDDLHPKANIDKMSGGIPLQDSDRWPWLDIIRDRAQVSLKQHKTFVVACSALKHEYRRRLCTDGVDGCFIYLHGSKELIIKRQSARTDHFMPPSLIDSQFDTLEVPTGEPNVLAVSIDQGVDEVVAEVLAHLRPKTNHG